MRIRFFAVAAIAALAMGAFAQGPKATPEEMINAIKAIKLPVYDPTKAEDKAYVQDYVKQRNAAMDEKAKLILAFYKEYPANEEAPALMSQRWGSLLKKIEDVPVVIKEVDEVLVAAPSDKMVETALFAKASYTMYLEDDAKTQAAVDAFVNKYPKDARGANLLGSVAESMKDKDKRLAMYERIIRDYPEGRGTKYIKGKVKQVNNLGKPFELNFTDAITGKPVTMADYKGKVVVIDFWATWCGPCIAELPKVQKMYADLKAKGVEIISVSLDHPEDKGGLTKLKDFVAKNNMPWAHYYQGNFWDSEFSTSWGVNSIPAMFLVDQNGILVDVQARSGLEDRIKALLPKS